MDLPNRNALFARGRRYLKGQANTRVNVALADVPGSDLNLLLGSSALMGEALSAAWARCSRGLFVDTAQKDQLDRIVYDRFGITRKPANAATVDVVAARPTFAGAGGTIPAGAQGTTADGSIFALQTDIVFGATDLTRPGTAVANVVGPTQNIPEGALSRWVDQPFDASITLTNPDDAAGGTDVESDPELRARARSFFLTVRRGLLAAIQYGATTVPGVSVSTAFDIVNFGTELPAGAVELIIGDANGNASGPLIQAVKDVLLEFRAGGIPVYVFGGQVQFTPVVYQLQFQSGIDTQAAAEEVRACAVAFCQFLRPGQPLLESDLIAAARNVPGVIVTRGSVVAPVGDVIPVNNQVILRVRPQDVSFL